MKHIPALPATEIVVGADEAPAHDVPNPRRNLRAGYDPGSDFLRFAPSCEGEQKKAKHQWSLTHARTKGEGKKNAQQSKIFPLAGRQAKGVPDMPGDEEKIRLIKALFLGGTPLSFKEGAGLKRFRARFPRKL